MKVINRGESVENGHLTLSSHSICSCDFAPYISESSSETKHKIYFNLYLLLYEHPFFKYPLSFHKYIHFQDSSGQMQVKIYEFFQVQFKI